jgi:hypothetical protein
MDQRPPTRPASLRRVRDEPVAAHADALAALLSLSLAAGRALH